MKIFSFDFLSLLSACLIWSIGTLKSQLSCIYIFIEFWVKKESRTKDEQRKLYFYCVAWLDAVFNYFFAMDSDVHNLRTETLKEQFQRVKSWIGISFYVNWFSWIAIIYKAK